MKVKLNLQRFAINLSTAGIFLAYAVEETAGTRPTAGYKKITGAKSTPSLNPSPETLETTTLDETGIYDASSNSNTYLGGPIVKHVAHDGTPITSSNIKSYEGTWATIEIQYTKDTLTNDYAKVFFNAYGYGDSNLYLTDITITNYSTLA